MPDGQSPSPQELEHRREVLAGLMMTTPFVSSLGLRVERFEADDVLLRLPFAARLTNDGQTLHGGVVASLLDTAGAAAAWSAHDLGAGTRGSTVALSVQYVRAARGIDVLARATTVRRARELIFVEVHAIDPSGGPIAHAVQTYRIA